MHILLIGTWDIKCGISLYTENIYREIKEQGHEVTILAEEAEERNRRYEVSEEGVIRCWKRCESWQRLLELVRGLPGVDVVNIQHEMSYCWQPHLWQQLIGGLHAYGLPVVVTYHTIPYAPHPLIDNPYVDGIIVCNPKAREAMIRRGWPADRIWRVQHGMLPECPSPPRRPTGRLAIYGFLSGSKGYSETMQAMQELLPRYPDLRLTIFGAISELIRENQEGYYYDDLRREITARGLQNRVAVLMGFPHQDMLHHLLADHDILVLYYKPGAGGYCESGALHTGLAAIRPVIVSKAHHFDCSPEMEPVMLKATTQTELVAMLDRLLSDEDFYHDICRRISDFVRARPLSNAAQDYLHCFAQIGAKTQSVPSQPIAPTLLGAVVLSRGRPRLLDRALQSLKDTSPEIPIVVVDNAGTSDTVNLMREKWGKIFYICTSRRMDRESLRLGIQALPAEYAKIVCEEDILLPGWYTLHHQLCQRKAPVISCSGIVVAPNTEKPVLNEEVTMSTQLCVSRATFSSLGPLGEVDPHAQAEVLYRSLQELGYTSSYVPNACFLRHGIEA